MRSDHIGPVTMTIGAALVLFASALGWVRSGTVMRSSYETLGIVERLGFAPSDAARTVIRIWPVMPVLVVAAVVLAWWGRRWAALAAGLVGGAYAGTIALVVATATPDTSQVGVSAAPAWAAAGAALLVVGSVLGVAIGIPSADDHSR